MANAVPFNVSIPLYHQIAQLLRQRVGVEGPDAAGLTERGLCEEFGVSRSTIRQALGHLKREGLLTSRRGVGTRRVQSAPEPRIARSAGDPLHAQLNTRARVISVEETVSQPAIASFLGLEVDSPVFRLVRVHDLDDAPLSVVISHLPPAVGAGLTLADLSARPLHDIIAQRCGAPLARSSHTVRVARADARIAALLDVSLADPVLYVRSHAYLADGRPIRWTDNYFREDRYEYAAEIEWPPLRREPRRRDGETLHQRRSP
ncbi:MAG: GntR family transcriptional regulator [Lautropia sp.]